MTENYWAQEKERIKKNKDNINPVLQQTFEDKKILDPKNFRVLYTNCLQGSLHLNQYARSENITIDDMAMLICRDKGCELQYCQASLHDPYEKPFENCDEQYNSFSSCMTAEKRRYIHDGQKTRNMNEQIEYMLEKKKKEKLMNIEIKNTPIEVDKEKNNFIKEKEYIVKTGNKKIEENI
jgi:hypothetical protein